MPATYYARSNNSDFTGSDLPTVHNQTLETTTAATATKSTGNIPASSSANGYAWTPSGVPGASGFSADYLVKVDISAGNNSIALSVAVARVNSSGVVQQESAATAEQTASAGTKTFNLEDIDLGAWAAGDRLRVRYIFRNTHATMTQACTVRYNSVESEVTMTELVTGYRINQFFSRMRGGFFRRMN